MARADILKVLYSKTLSPLEFKFESLVIPSMYNYLTPYDIQALNDVATSVMYNANRKLKEKEIDRIMVNRSFRRFHCGTNRVVYRHLEDPRFVAKIALDRTGLKDNPSEFKNQAYLKPFITKVFEVSPCGTVGFVEKVEPITSREEFLNIANDVFDVLVYGLIGLYALDDVGTDFFMNWGVRLGFGPVLLDFPYVFRLDGNKLHCALPEIDPYGNRTGRICDGEIDYDDGFNYLVCPKCGKKYCARDLAEAQQDNLIILKGGQEDMPLKVCVFFGDKPLGGSEPQKETDKIVYTSASKKPTISNSIGGLKVALAKMPNPAERPKTADFSKVSERFGEADREVFPPVIQERLEQKAALEEAYEKKSTPELIVGFPPKQESNAQTTADQVMITENKKNYTSPVKIPEADIAKPKGGITFSFNGKETTIGNPTVKEKKTDKREGTPMKKGPKFNHNYKAKFNVIEDQSEQPQVKEEVIKEPVAEEPAPKVTVELNGVPGTSQTNDYSRFQQIIDSMSERKMDEESTYPQMTIDTVFKKLPSSDMVNSMRTIIEDLRSDIKDGMIDLDENADDTLIDHCGYKYHGCTADSYIKRNNGDIFINIVEDEYPDQPFKFRNNIKEMYPDIIFDMPDDEEDNDEEDVDKEAIDTESTDESEEPSDEVPAEEEQVQKIDTSNYEPLFPKLTEDFKRMCKESLPENSNRIDAKVFKISGDPHVFVMPMYEGEIYDSPIQRGTFDELFEKICENRGITFPENVKAKLMEEITDDNSFNIIIAGNARIVSPNTISNPDGLSNDAKHTVKREQHHTDPSNLASF